jgi:hypothetical protein
MLLTNYKNIGLTSVSESLVLFKKTFITRAVTNF